MSRPVADEFDAIPRLLRVVRGKLGDGSPREPGIRVKISLGFVFVVLVATCSGPRPAPLLGVALMATLLLYELPGAVWARSLGRFVRVSIDSSGGRSEITGEPLPPRWRLFAAFAGSAASLGAGYALFRLAPLWRSAAVAEAGRLNLIWGALQLLPLSPFKLGSILREHVSHWARVKHSVASFGFALAVLIKCASQLEVPLFLIAFAVWLHACARELWLSVALARDAGLDSERRLTEIRELTLAESPRRAIALAQELLATARSTELRARTREALAWAAIGASDAALATEAIAELPDRCLNAYLLASCLTVCNRLREAIVLLEDALRMGRRSVESLRLLADLYYRERDRAALTDLLRSAADLLSEAELERIQHVMARISEA